MRKVADRVGISATAIYRHYKDKDELLTGIIDTGLHILEGYLEPALKAPTPFERLIRLADRFLDFALEEPRYFEFAFMVRSQAIGDVHTELSEKNWVTFKLAMEQIAACMEDGTFKKDDPVGTAITLWASVYGLIALYRMHRFGPSDEMFRGLYRSSVHRLLDGLKA